MREFLVLICLFTLTDCSKKPDVVKSSQIPSVQVPSASPSPTPVPKKSQPKKK